MQDLFVTLKPYFLFLHAIGFIVGLGSAIVADTLFFRFLKDLRISKEEEYILSYVGRLVIIGLIVLLISGIGIFLSDPVKYLASSKFLTKMAIVVVIAINGFLLHRYLAPRLTLIEWDKGAHAKNRRARKMAAALGAVSSTSWFSALLLGYLRSIPFTFGQAFWCYILLLLCAIGVSQILENYFARQMDHVFEVFDPFKDNE